MLAEFLDQKSKRSCVVASREEWTEAVAVGFVNAQLAEALAAQVNDIGPSEG